MIDNVLGLGMQIEKAGDDQYLLLKMEINDNMLYGESEIPDCPDQRNGDYCVIINKRAIHPPASATKGKVPHTTAASSLPLYKIKGDTSWGSKTTLTNNTFTGFNGKTRMGMQNVMFSSSFYQPDYTPMLEFDNTKFVDIADNGFAYFSDPFEEWAVISDCGNFPCTGPKNILYDFRGSVWSGSQPSLAPAEFQLIANNSGFAPFIAECLPRPLMNSYFCTKPSLSILHFDSLDSDRLDRSVQPVYTRLQGT